MANEWVKVELLGPNRDGEPRRFTIADGDAVSKGSICGLDDPRTANVTPTVGMPIGGIASEEHVPGQGITEISLWTDGIFEATSSGATVIGRGIIAAGDGGANVDNNKFAADLGSPAASGACIMGYVMEDADDVEVVNVRLRL